MSRYWQLMMRLFIFKLIFSQNWILFALIHTWTMHFDSFFPLTFPDLDPAWVIVVDHETFLQAFLKIVDEWVKNSNLSLNYIERNLWYRTVSALNVLYLLYLCLLFCQCLLQLTTTVHIGLPSINQNDQDTSCNLIGFEYFFKFWYLGVFVWFLESLFSFVLFLYNCLFLNWPIINVKQ